MRSTACQVLGCHVDVSCEQKPYCLKRKCCLYHLKADAVELKGKEGVWRWCFQCGKMQRLSEFDAAHRNCRVSLMKRHIASHKPRRTGSDNRQSLDARSGAAPSAGMKAEQPLELDEQMCLQQAAPVGECTPSSSCCQQHEPLHALHGSGSCLSGKAPAAGSSVLPPPQQQQLCAAASLRSPLFPGLPDAVAVAEAAAGGAQQALMLVDALIDEMGLLPAFEMPQASISSPAAGQEQLQHQTAADTTAAALEDMIEQEMLAAAQSVSGSGSGDFGAALAMHHAACDALSSSSSNGMAGPAAAAAEMELQWEAAQRAFQCGATNNGSIVSESQLHELLQQQLREEEELQAAMLWSQQSFQFNNRSGVNPTPDAVAMAAGATLQPFAAPCGGKSAGANDSVRQARMVLLQQQYYELQAAIEGMKQQVANIQSCLPCAAGFAW